MADQEAKLKEVGSRVDKAVDGVAAEMGVENPQTKKKTEEPVKVAAKQPAAPKKAAPVERP